MKKWILLILLVVGLSIFFHSLTHKLPIPFDIVTGTYYPWLNDRYQGLTTSTPVKNPILSDAVSQVYPWRNHLSTNLRTGLSPFWNKNSLAGFPFISSFYATSFYNPIGFLTAYLPTPIGISVYLYGQIIVITIAGFMLFRQYKLTNSLSILGGLTLSLVGLASTWFEFGSGNYSFAAIIFLITALEKYFSVNRRALWPIPFAILFLVSTGNPQLIIFGGLIACLYSVLRVPLSDFIKRHLFPLILRGFLGLILCIPIILPVYRVYQQSIRPTDRYINEYAGGTISFSHFLTLISPDYYGNPATYNYRGEMNYLELSGYAGLLTLGLFIFGLFVKPYTFARRFFIGLTIISFVLVTRHPLTDYLYQLPIPILGSSSASRLLFIFDLGLVVSAILTLALVRHHPRKLFAIACICFFFSFLTLFSHTRATLPSIAIGLTLIVIVWLGRLFRSFPIALLFGLVLILDLSRYFLKFNVFTSNSLAFPVTEEISFLQQAIDPLVPARFQPYGSAEFPPNFHEVYGLESASGYHSAYPRWYGEFVGIVNDGFPTPNPGRYLEVKNPSSSLFDFLNIRYILVNTDSCTSSRIERIEVCTVMNNPKFSLVFTHENQAIFENNHALPRFQLISNYQVLVPGDISKAIVKSNYSPDSIVYLENTPNFTSHPNTHSSIQVQQYTNSLITLSIKTDSNTLLVVSNTYDSGWRAIVNNDLVIPVMRANYAFQAYPLPRGEYSLELSYSPWWAHFN